MKQLPEKLKVGMKLKCCARACEGDEIVEIVKIDDYGRVLLRRENGLAIRGTFSRQELVDYDYMIMEER